MKQKELVTLAGGCFWCTEAIFKRIKGVLEVTSGYTGGHLDNPSYTQVTSGDTGHAEAIQIVIDPEIISYEKILDIFWHLHDPTTLNQQGADKGTQYRSVILYHNDQQKIIAEQSKKAIEMSKYYSDPIVTEIQPFQKFYKAEDYHQNYFDVNPSQSYCSLVIDPKIKKLIELYNADIKEDFLS
jgi:peptide-methionine (S)-S-oxide reductase